MRHLRSRKGEDSGAALIDFPVRAHQGIATGHAGGRLPYARGGDVSFHPM
jgi:hypothetical protein